MSEGEASFGCADANLAAMHDALLAAYAVPPQVRRRGPRTPAAARACLLRLARRL